MMADVVDEDEMATGAQRSGLFFGLMLTAAKLGIAIGPVSYAALALFGFDASLGAANAPAAMRALDVLFIGAPILFYLSVAVMMRGFPIDEARQRALRTAIDERRSRRYDGMSTAKSSPGAVGTPSSSENVTLWKRPSAEASP